MVVICIVTFFEYEMWVLQVCVRDSVCPFVPSCRYQSPDARMLFQQITGWHAKSRLCFDYKNSNPNPFIGIKTEFITPFFSNVPFEMVTTCNQLFYNEKKKRAIPFRMLIVDFLRKKKLAEVKHV